MGFIWTIPAQVKRIIWLMYSNRRHPSPLTWTKEPNERKVHEFIYNYLCLGHTMLAMCTLLKCYLLLKNHLKLPINSKFQRVLYGMCGTSRRKRREVLYCVFPSFDKIFACGIFTGSQRKEWLDDKRNSGHKGVP